jgi:hypothetical protein
VPAHNLRQLQAQCVDFLDAEVSQQDGRVVPRQTHLPDSKGKLIRMSEC